MFVAIQILIQHVVSDFVRGKTHSDIFFIIEKALPFKKHTIETLKVRSTKPSPIISKPECQLPIAHHGFPVQGNMILTIIVSLAYTFCGIFLPDGKTGQTEPALAVSTDKAMRR